MKITKNRKQMLNNFDTTKIYEPVEAIKILKKVHKGIVGAYPNNGYFEKPHWKLINDISPSKYLEEAKNWISNGAQIIGGCCGVGPDKISAISVLK